MPSVQSRPRLPPELLLDILDTASTRTLHSASLVCHSWRAPAQHVLEGRLSLPTSKVARTWLSCPGRKTRTRRLSLGAGLSREESEEVFSTVDGLEELLLVGNDSNSRIKFDARALQHEQLAGLKQLYVRAPFHDTRSNEPSLRFPFALTSLACKGPYRAFPASFLSALIASSGKTLTTLDLDCYGSNPSASAFISSLSALTSTITHLELHGADRQTPALLDFLASCTALTTLTCWEATLPLLQALPPSLKNLDIRKDYTFHSESPYEELLTRSGLLRQLESVRFGGISSATLRAQVGGCELLDECKERGIDVAFGVEVSGRYGTYGWPMLGGGKMGP
ncbi:hypothetical protein JCM10207_007978 [Rhodosporidiobolus poonsookiae]